MPRTRPNVLLLMADDHRADAMSCAGDMGIPTPHMDALVARGVRCEHARIMGGHTPAVCVPSRATLNTGRSPFRTSCGTNSYDEIRRLRPDAVTLGQALSAAGWSTFHTGKWHLDAASFNRSFADGAGIFFGGMGDHYNLPLHRYDATGIYSQANQQANHQPDARHSTEVFAAEAMDFLTRHRASQIESQSADDRPFFLSCCFTAPHDPRQAPPAWHARFRADAVTLPANFMAEHPFDNGELDIRDEQLCPRPRTEARIRKEIADYHAMIAHMDDAIGRILATLESQGLAENTVVIYTGDHGLAVGRHGLLGKQNQYEHSLRIPMLLAGPGLPCGLLHPGMVLNLDLMPTLLDLCGVPTPAGLDGHSFLPRLADGGDNHQEAYAVYMDFQESLVSAGWKVVRYHRRPNGHGSDRVQLFDLKADPDELHDRSEDPTCVKRRQQLLERLAIRRAVVIA